MAKTKKESTAPAVEINDGVDDALFKQGLEVRAKQGQGEWELFQGFAREMLAGRLSTRGYVATIEAVEAQAGKFAEIRTSHASYITLMAKVSTLPDSPKSHSGLYSIALGLIRAESAHGKDARKVAMGKVIQAQAKPAQAPKLIESATKANARYAKAKADKAGANGKDSKVTAMKLDTETISQFETLVKGAMNLDEKTLGHLLTLKATIDTILGLEGALPMVD